MRHIVWDWNGTLYDDLDIIVASANESLAAIGIGPIDADGYRDHYQRPIRGFFDALAGRSVSAVEMDRARSAFFAAYERRRRDGTLNADARTALDRLRSSGDTQSVLSMAPHGDLVPLTRDLDVFGYMALVQGSNGSADGRKARMLRDHLAALGGAIGDFDRRIVTVVGDSLDDVDAARGAGVGAVLYDGGSHHRADLDAAGVPVASTLLEAIERAGDSTVG